MPFLKIDQNSDSTTVKGFTIENKLSIPREIPILATPIHPTKETPIQPPLFNLTPITNSVDNWQVIVLVLTIALVGFTKAFNNSRFKQTMRGLFKYGVALEITREEKVFFHQSTILFTITHLLTTSLFIYQIKEFINGVSLEINNLWLFILIIGFVITTYFVKYIFAQILFFILDNRSLAAEYIFNVSLYNNLLGVILIPVLAATYFSSLPFSLILLYISAPLILLIFILRLIRLYFIGISKGISYFYIFLYICSLEILPLVVLLRIFIF